MPSKKNRRHNRPNLFVNVSKQISQPVTASIPSSNFNRKASLDRTNEDISNHEEQLLLTVESQWVLGDWHSLAQLQRDQIKQHSNRAKLALLVAAGHIQLSQNIEARQYIHLAQEWGAEKKLISQILIAGIHYNLECLAAIYNQQSNALQHFENFNKFSKDILSSSYSIPHVFVNNYIRSQKENLWFSKEVTNFGYSDGDYIEERILGVVCSAEDISLYSQTLNSHQMDWPSRYHLSADRANLLRPLAAKLANSKILELGCGCGAITRYLGELGTQVIAVEGSQRRAQIASARCRDLSNVTVVVDRLQNLPFEECFDVVTLIGVLEYSRVYVDGENPVQIVLQKAKQYLKPNGLLIIAIENQLGLKYFAGAPEDHGMGVMSGINDLYRKDTAVTFGHKELTSHLINAGFSKMETFLPFPDYKMPSLVLHPLGYEAEDKNWNLATLLRNAVSIEPQPIQSPLFSLERAWPLIQRNKLLTDLANSYLLIATRNYENELTNPAIMASYFSPRRGREFSKQIDFFLDKQSNIATRVFSLKNTATSYDINLTKIEDYIVGEIHVDALQDIIQRSNWSLAEIIPWVKDWFDVLISHIITPDEETKALNWSEYGNWLPSNYLDAIPRNLVIKPNGEKVFIDLEWQETHDLPLILVFYRGLWVTLATLTSIAAPEDPAMVDTEALIETILQSFGIKMTELDFERFMPIIDRVHRRAQELEIPHLQLKKSYLGKRLKVRQKLPSHYKMTTITLYWANKGEKFNENQIFRQAYNLDGQLNTFHLKIPPTNKKSIKLRLDIATCTGYFFIQQLKIKDIASEDIWIWDFDTHRFKNIADLIFFDCNNKTQANLLSTGRDPQFQLELPNEILQKLSEASLVIEMSGLPCFTKS
jgi:SAM-dependent methyltransferase